MTKKELLFSNALATIGAGVFYGFSAEFMEKAKNFAEQVGADFNDSETTKTMLNKALREIRAAE